MYFIMVMGSLTFVLLALYLARVGLACILSDYMLQKKMISVQNTDSLPECDDELLNLKEYVSIDLASMDSPGPSVYHPDMIGELKAFLKPGTRVRNVRYGNVIFTDKAMLLENDGLHVTLTYYAPVLEAIKLRDDLPAEEYDYLSRLLTGISEYHQWLFRQKVSGGITGIANDLSIETQSTKFTVKRPIQ